MQSQEKTNFIRRTRNKYETDPAVCGAIQESYHKYFNLKANRTLSNLDPAQFVPGLDIEMMYRDMYLASEGYLWEMAQRCNMDKVHHAFRLCGRLGNRQYSKP